MEFNKKVSRKYIINGKPTIVFRKLSGDKERYQGSLNKLSTDMLSQLVDGSLDFNVLFSDKHAFVGISPFGGENKPKRTFGATELFVNLKLLTGKHYTLKIDDGVGVIDSNEFNK
jgi:hypothetical protein